MKILIVDDNKNIREFIKEIIADLGFQIAEASNGLMAITKVKLFNPEIILMDIKMDIMDGIEATTEIRKLSSTARIIIVTDYSEKSLIDKAMKAGADECLLKKELINLKNLLSINK
ncbi:MAG: response regulator [Ignavibacteriaceae bacterium]|nr:response regulator [Ignavibacteriaceae bacterium]